MKTFTLLLLLFLPVQAWSCSCLRIASMEEAIAYRPILVEAEAVSLEVVDTPEYGRQVHSATLRVNRVLKGTMTTETIVVENLMCYASLHPDLMKPGHVYILPLLASGNGRHSMAGCSHSGMELVDGNLYTFEQAAGIHRKQRFYRKYARFLKAYRKPAINRR